MSEEDLDRIMAEKRRKEVAATRKLALFIGGMFLASFVAAITFVLIIIWAVKHL